MTPKNHIHKHLKEQTPKGVKRARRIFHFRYPKLVIFLLCFLAAYILFKNENINFLISLSKMGYLSNFIGGVLVAFGFTAPFGIGFLISSSPENIFIAALIAGIGAMVSDLIIFKFMKFSFMDEFRKLERTKTIKEIEGIVKKNKHILIKHYLLYVFAGIIIVSPLPDEIGVSMLAGLTTIKAERLAILSFILHTIAIFFIIYLGTII